MAVTGKRDLHAVPRTLSASALLLLTFLSAGCGSEPPAPEVSAPAGIIQELQSDSSITTDVNARAPAFAREDRSGNIVKTQDYIGGKVLLLDFWSIFCQSCLQEIPFLQELHRDYHDEGLEIISINTDFFPQVRIEKFMEKTGIDLPYTILFDRDQSLSKLFQVEALPVTVLIDSSGWIRMVHLGYRPDDQKMIESRVRRYCRKIKETVVTLQPVEGQTAYAPPGRGRSLLDRDSPAPDFEALGEGGASTFSSLREGEPSVIFFWSLFCQPCKEEFPRLVALAKKYSERGLRIFAVNVDTAKLRPAASRFAGKRGKGLISLFDEVPSGKTGKAAEAFGVHFTPSLFFISPDGKVLFSASGEVSSADLERQVADLFAESGESGSLEGAEK
jgi:thiol-disulfide isomerase/thioredoxin